MTRGASIYLPSAGAALCGATTDISLPQGGLKHSIPPAAVRTHEAGEAIREHVRNELGLIRFSAKDGDVESPSVKISIGSVSPLFP